MSDLEELQPSAQHERRMIHAVLKARLHPIKAAGGYRYSVIFGGELLVDRSRDPECDAARALMARGIVGKLTLLDSATGKPRTVIDIEKAAKLTVEEGPHGPRFAKYRTAVDRAPSPASDQAGREVANTHPDAPHEEAA
jgi:hypothetical protein